MYGSIDPLTSQITTRGRGFNRLHAIGDRDELSAVPRVDAKQSPEVDRPAPPWFPAPGDPEPRRPCQLRHRGFCQGDVLGHERREILSLPRLVGAVGANVNREIRSRLFAIAKIGRRRAGRDQSNVRLGSKRHVHRAGKRTRRCRPDPPELIEEAIELRAIVAPIHEHGAERVAHVRLALDPNPGERANRVGDAARSHRDAGGAKRAGKDDDVGQKRLGHERGPLRARLRNLRNLRYRCHLCHLWPTD